MGKIFKKKPSEVSEKKKEAPRHTIMLVDDEELFLRSLESLLSEQYDIITAVISQRIIFAPS